MKQIFTQANDMENDETKRYKDHLDLFLGKLVNDLGEMAKGKLVMPNLSSFTQNFLVIVP